MIDHDELARAVADRLGRRAEALPLAAGSLGAVQHRARQRQQRRLAGAGAVGIAAAAIGTVTLLHRDDAPSSVVPATSDVASTSTAETSSTSDTTAIEPGASDLRRGDTGTAVQQLQTALKARGFDPGPADGTFGIATEQAVWAAEGVLLGRTWQEQTGVADTALLDAVASAPAIAPRRVIEGDHTEIYLDLQALVVFHGFDPVLVTHISSGDGQAWCAVIIQDTDDKGQLQPEPVEKDVCGVSRTPGGVFQFYRRVHGTRQGPLGDMYNPVYFNYSIAVHGAQNVPRVPASHGAIRIPMFIADYFPALVKNKDFVYVWDGTTEPEQQTKKDMLPTFDYPNPNATTTTAASTG